MLSAIWKRIQGEPAATMATVNAAGALILGFGDWVTSTQMGLILGFLAAVLGLATRRQVTPT